MDNTLEQQAQLKKFTDDKNSVLAELYLTKNENDKLSAENKNLTISVRDLTAKETDLKKKIGERDTLAAEIARNKLENQKLISIKQELNDFILKQQDDIQLKSWAGKRDAILAETAKLKEEKIKLEKCNQELADSLTDINNAIILTTGRMTELDKQEKDYESILSIGVSNLTSEKSRLESEVSNFNKMIAVLSSQKKSLEDDILSLTKVFDSVNSRVGVLDKVVDHVVTVSAENERVVSNLVSNLKSDLGKLIEVNQKNVFETNIVINKLPKMLMEAQKHGLIKIRI